MADLDVVDLSAMDHVRQIAYVNIGRKVHWRIEREVRVPMSTVNKMQEILGDGNATVTVGLDVKQSVDYGNSAGCSVFVKLTCNQDEDSIEKAHNIATELAKKWVDDGQSEAAVILNRARGFEDEEEEPSNPKPAASRKPQFKR